MNSHQRRILKRKMAREVDSNNPSVIGTVVNYSNEKIDNPLVIEGIASQVEGKRKLNFWQRLLRFLRIIK